MPIKISIARSPEKIDQVFKVRHKVFCEEEGKFPAEADGRIIDRFDTYPTTANLIAEFDGQIVGSLRLTLDSPMGVPADEFYPFRSHTPPHAKIMGSGMYCVTLPFRGVGMAVSMIMMAGYFAASNEVTHVVGPINPDIAKLVSRVGFRILGEEVVEPHTGLSILPACLDMKDLKDNFMNFVRKNRMQNFLGSYECVIYKEGEDVVRKGEKGECAYVIIDGEAQVLYPDRRTVVATLGEGEVFGELALLTDETRSADVRAKSDLRVMTLDKSIFMEHLLTHPEKAVSLMKDMGKRMKKVIEQVR